MNAKQADSNTDQFLVLDKLQDLIDFGCDRARKGFEQGNDFLAVLETSTSQFTRDKRMAQDLFSRQEFLQVRVTFPEVGNPCRRVHQDHAHWRASLLLRTG